MSNMEIPHDEITEVAVLGASLLESDAFPKIADMVSVDTFYIPAHKHIFTAISELYKSGEPIDIVTATMKLRSLDLLSDAGGAFKLTSLTNQVNQSGNIIHYARLLQQLEIKRKLIAITNNIASKAYDETQDAFELLNELDQSLIQFGNSQMNTVVKIDQVCESVGKSLLDPDIKDIGKVVPTDIRLLDEYLGGGIKLNRYVLLAGRPGMGKTSLVLQLMLNMARNGVPIMFFSRETDKESILKRLICNIAGIEEHRMNSVSLEEFQQGKKTRLTTIEVDLVTDALSQLSKLPVYINDTTGMNVHDCVAITKKMIYQHNIKFAVGDYIQLLNGEKSQGRTNEISEISRVLKAVSQNNNVTVIELAQLNRSVETRGGDKRPMLSDLRESGQLEQDGQLIIMLYRPEYYDIMEDADGFSTSNLLELIIVKNKDGATNTIPVKFEGKYFRVSDFEF